MKPLVTNKLFEELLSSFQEKIIKRFEKNTKIGLFESRITWHHNALEKLEIKYNDNEHYDDNEHYSRC